MIVAKLSGTVPGANVNFGFNIVFPDGAVRAPTPADNTVAIDVAEDYLFVRLRDLPIPQVGRYQIILELNGARALKIELPVAVVGQPSTDPEPKVH